MVLFLNVEKLKYVCLYSFFFYFSKDSVILKIKLMSWLARIFKRYSINGNQLFTNYLITFQCVQLNREAKYSVLNW